MVFVNLFQKCALFGQGLLYNSNLNSKLAETVELMFRIEPAKAARLKPVLKQQCPDLIPGVCVCVCVCVYV